MGQHRGLALGLAFGVGLLGTFVVFDDAPPTEAPAAFIEPTDPIPELKRAKVDEDGMVVPRAPAPLGETRRNAVPPSKRTRLSVFACATASRSFLALLEKDFEAANREVDLAITTRTDRDCIDFLLMHDADVAIVSSPLSANEKSRGLVQSTLGHFLAVAVVHPTNRVESVTTQQLENLRTGRTTSWAKVGGDQIQVQPVCGQPTRIDDFVSRSLRFAGKASGLALHMRYPREILSYVANEPRALGLLPWRRAEDDRSVKVLEIFDAKPSIQGLKNGSWPLGATIRLITKRNPPAAVRRFEQFLASERTRRVLRETLVLPN